MEHTKTIYRKGPRCIYTHDGKQCERLAHEGGLCWAHGPETDYDKQHRARNLEAVKLYYHKMRDLYIEASNLPPDKLTPAHNKAIHYMTMRKVKSHSVSGA
jgi:hypothetical protein